MTCACGHTAQQHLETRGPCLVARCGCQAVTEQPLAQLCEHGILLAAWCPSCDALLLTALDLKESRD